MPGIANDSRLHALRKHASVVTWWILSKHRGLLCRGIGKFPEFFVGSWKDIIQEGFHGSWKWNGTEILFYRSFSTVLRPWIPLLNSWVLCYFSPPLQQKNREAPASISHSLLQTKHVTQHAPDQACHTAYPRSSISHSLRLPQVRTFIFSDLFCLSLLQCSTWVSILLDMQRQQ